VIQAIAAFADNYIWAITDDQQGLAAVVDPGDAGPVLDFLQRHRLKLAAILITHHHGDHTGGIAGLKAAYQSTPMIKDLRVYGPAAESIPGMTDPLHEGDALVLDGLDCALQVIEVPGHTRGHIAFYGHHHGAPVLFCGDTLFAAGCGRLFEGSAAQMWASLQKLAGLPEQTAVYCAHEYTLANLRFACAAYPHHREIANRLEEVKSLRDQQRITLPSTIALERTTNPFLLCANAQTFADLRQQKDSFRG
jgi:hydroxyacylglutathione hydrolase